jgi:hypothetical protein
MTDAEPFIERLHQLIGRDCHFYGHRYRIVEILDNDARVVLESRDTTPPIQVDQYGQATYRGSEHIEVEMFDQGGELSEDLLHLLDGVRADV